MLSRSMIVGLVLIYSFLEPVTAIAQPKCSIEHFSTANGLSDNRIMCIMKDSEGFMWMGNWTGINRFDGHNFVTYKSHPGDQSELKNNRVDLIVEGGPGFLWLKAYDRQLYRFDKKTEQFLSVSKFLQPGRKSKIEIDDIVRLKKGQIALTTKSQGFFLVSAADSDKPVSSWFSKNAATPYQLPSDSITCFYQDSASDIWLGSKLGLSRLQADSGGSYKKADVPAGLRHASITNITENASCLWFSTADGKLLSVNKRTGKLVTFNISTGRINGLRVSNDRRDLYLSTSNGEIVSISLDSLKVSLAGIFPGNELLSIYEDRTGRLWLEPKENGVVMFDPRNKRFQLFTQPNYSNYIHDAGEYGVLEDNKGVVWVNMRGCGFGYFDSAAVAIRYFYNEPGFAGKKFSNMISAEFFDPAGILWLSSDEGGLEKIVFQPNEFLQARLVNNTFLKAENDVRGICEDRKGRLWVGTKARKLFVSGEDGVVDRLFGGAPRFQGGVYAILEDSKGNIWVGTKGDGLYKAEPVNDKREQYRVKHYLVNSNDPYSISNNIIYSLLEDNKGRIWAGTFGGGINLIDNAGPGTRFYNHANRFTGYPMECNRIRHLACDAEGRIWIGTTDGLLLFDPNNKNTFNTNFVLYRKIPGNRESLGDNDVQYVYRDRHNTMWVLTSSGGLNKATGGNPMQSLQFLNFSTKDGLPSDYLFSCGEDRQGCLWIASQSGLSRFDLSKNTIRNFDLADGLPEVAFAEASCVSTKNGDLVFGSSNGYIRVSPAGIVNPRINANIALTNLQVNSDDVYPGQSGAPLKYAVNNSDGITLHYDQNVISFDYTVLDYRSQDKEAYAYRLIGFDSAWRNNKSARRASYTNLPPGSYTFQVKSTNTDLYYNAPVKSIAITILPPPWKTWWAYLVYTLLAALLLLVVRKNALTMLRLRQHIIIERKLADFRLNFFTNVSHELRTPLTLILNPLEEIARKESLSEQGNRHLNLVRKNARRMVRFVNQLLDLRKAQSGKAPLMISQVELVSFVRRITGYFTDMAHQKEISLSIEPEAEQVFCWIDAEKIDIVIYNVLANAFKFTQTGKHIHITIGHSGPDDDIIVEIIDEGAGVPSHQLDDIFGLYFEGQHSEGNSMKGTGIGLALSRELVQLHEGRISARNNTPQGLVVKIELKAGKAHFEKSGVVFTDTVPAFEDPRPEDLTSAGEWPGGEEIPQDMRGLPLLLLVEDNRDLRSFLKTQLGGLYRVEAAENGEEGLSKAEALLPDVILSDVMMPVMDGIRMLDKLKNNLLTSHIPVVLLSAKFSVESQIEGLKYGADYYIAKPFNNEFLIASLGNLIAQRKRIFEYILKDKTAPGINPSPIAITSHDELFLKKVIETVEEKMGDIQFNIDVVADSMNMSRSPFYKKLKSLTGLSPVEFIREIRLKRSLQYLDAGEHNISLIAYEVGFKSPKYFSTCFKQRFGQTPSEYVKTNSKASS